METLRQYFVALMRDERNGFLDRPVKAVLHLVSFIYTAAVLVVDRVWRSGVRRGHKMPVPVVSIGNITLGGTGKTPFAVFLADHYLAKGRKPAVLTRGYGGDECRMMKDELPDTSVFAGQDRVKSARRAVAAGRDVLILDDGFQHRRIGRDLDILLLDAGCMFGNGAMFPRGILREPVASLNRADIFVLTKADRVDAGRVKSMSRELQRRAPGRPVVTSRYRVSFMTDVTGAVYAAESFRGKRVVLLSGVADPDYFAHLVEKQGAVIAARHDHEDHHRYTRLDIARVHAECVKKQAEAIITTGKDYVKLKDLDISGIEDKLFVMNVAVDILEGKEQLIGRLDSVILRQGV